MAAAAQARRAAAAPRRQDYETPRPVRPSARRAPQERARAARRARLTRTFIIFTVCLTVLAVGRVSLSFAVVQKSLQTDAVVTEQRRVVAENAKLSEDVARLSSTVRIRHVAETQLGLEDASHVTYLRVSKGGTVTEVAARP